MKTTEFKQLVERVLGDSHEALEWVDMFTRQKSHINDISKAANKRKREKIKQDPIKYQEYLNKARIKSAKQLKKIKQDPVRYAKYLEAMRLYNRNFYQRKKRGDMR